MHYQTNSKVYFISDTHFAHANILKYCGRPFESIEEHDKELIGNWNSMVGTDDHVYHLGDVALGHSGEGRKIIGQLNGKIHLITGNHESVARSNGDLFEWVKDYHEISVDTGNRYPLTMVLFHYPIDQWNKCHYGSLHLHGHIHSTLVQTAENRIDVGVDTWAYAPVSLQKILELRDQPYE